MEEWKDIVGYEDSYMISSFGNVLSKERNILRIDIRGYSYSYKRGGKYLKNVCHKDGYAKVSLLKDGKAKQVSVHRLVAEHFIENPLCLPQVNHKDGDKHNPNISNLEWVTASENGIHAYINGLSYSWNKGMYGGDNNRSKIVKQTYQNGEYVIWDSMMSAKRNGYDTGCICRCCQGKSKTHKGSYWSYTDKEVTENTLLVP